MSRASSPLKDRMIFLVGARRSGTNWLQRILATHPAVVAVPSETGFFSHGVRHVMERVHHSVASSPNTAFVYMDRDAMLDGLRDFCDSLFSGLRDVIDPGAERILERTPDHVRWLGPISDIYPDGRFVHIVRDGRSVARSLVSQSWGPATITEAAEEWRSAIEAARAVAPSLQHYTEVRYETLLDDPRAGSRDLFERLGLDASDDVLDACLVEAGVKFNVDPSAPHVTADKWRGMSDEELAGFMEVAGTTLGELGYDTAPGPRAPAETKAREPAPPSRPTIVTRVKRSLRSKPHEPDAPRETVSRGLWVVHRVMEAIHTGRLDGLDNLIAPDAHVAIVRGGSTMWSGRGSTAVERLRSDLAADAAFRGHQVHADIHSGIPYHTVVASYETNGTRHDRVLVLCVNDEMVTRISCYRFD